MNQGKAKHVYRLLSENSNEDNQMLAQMAIMTWAFPIPSGLFCTSCANHEHTLKIVSRGYAKADIRVLLLVKDQPFPSAVGRHRYRRWLVSKFPLVSTYGTDL